MSNAATTPAPNASPVRPGTLAPQAPLDFLISELEKLSGHELTLKSSGDGYVLFDETAGDAMSEGPTRAECVANAFDCYSPDMAPLKSSFETNWGAL